MKPLQDLDKKKLKHIKLIVSDLDGVIVQRGTKIKQKAFKNQNNIFIKRTCQRRMYTNNNVGLLTSTKKSTCKKSNYHLMNALSM